MRPHRTALATAAALLALTGCEAAKNAAGDIVSSATAAVASAAQEKMNEVKDGVNATADVKAGKARADGDRTVADVTATNPKDSAADYTVMVTFHDGDGNVVDTVVVTLDAVPAKQAKTGTARSNRSLPGGTTAEVTRALRH
ncbi:hypothetical protein [Streptomyces sp.]|uniref:hypothetical protein n=1 Tax=Streptomyces sp. TaxID=1931 RepID=UPI002811D1E7|nr:hypothetical protein [Streptomyces sp.]